MTDKYILDAQGEVVACDDLLQWGKWFQASRDKRRVAWEKVGESEVSTVFLGLDHNWGGGVPLIFETLVFGGPLDQEMDRYSTREEALAGHQAMVQRVKEARS